MPIAERARCLEALAQRIDNHTEELALMDAVDAGNALSGMRSDMEWTANTLRYFAGLITEIKGESSSQGCRNVSAGRSAPGRSPGRSRDWPRCRQAQIVAIEHERDHPATSCVATERKRHDLLRLKGFGPALSSTLTREVYYRRFANRRQVASYIGVAPSPYDSGDGRRSQGISKAGNRLARVAMVEAAWLWLRHQPESALSQWFHDRTQGQKGRIPRVMIVALARKLAIALWRYLETGLIPEGIRAHQAGEEATDRAV